MRVVSTPHTVGGASILRTTNQEAARDDGGQLRVSVSCGLSVWVKVDPPPREQQEERGRGRRRGEGEERNFNNTQLLLPSYGDRREGGREREEWSLSSLRNSQN